MPGHCKVMGICLQMACKMSYVPLNAENCLQNVEKNQNFIIAFFFHLDSKKCLHKLNASVLSCNRFFCKLTCTKVRRTIVITLTSAWELASNFKVYILFFFYF